MTRSHSPIYGDPQLKVGDLVVPVEDKHVLHCGSGPYSCAMVVRLEPFAMTSPSGDMLWSTDKHQDHYRKESVATPAMFNAGMNRLPPAEQSRMPVGESYLTLDLGCGLTALGYVRYNDVADMPAAMDLNEDSSAYGWYFMYNSKEKLWKAHHEATPDQLAWEKNASAQRHEVFDTLMSSTRLLAKTTVAVENDPAPFQTPMPDQRGGGIVPDEPIGSADHRL